MACKDSALQLPQKPPLDKKVPGQVLGPGFAKCHIKYLQNSLPLSGLPIRPRTTDNINAELFSKSARTEFKPLPFQQTFLGRLPGEIRGKIYKHVLTIKKAEPGKNSSVMIKKKSNTESCLAILATCRRTYLEARHVFYESKTLRLAHSADLLEFLKAIGPIRRADITSLHLEDLLESYHFHNEAFLEIYCHRNKISGHRRHLLENIEGQRPNSAAKQALQLLNHSPRLRHILFDIPGGKELAYLRYPLKIPGLELAEVDFTDNSQWILRESALGTSWYADFVAGMNKNTWSGPRCHFQNRGKMHTVEVKILPPLQVGTFFPHESLEDHKARGDHRYQRGKAQFAALEQVKPRNRVDIGSIPQNGGGDSDMIASLGARFDALSLL